MGGLSSPLIHPINSRNFKNFRKNFSKNTLTIRE
jgi:dihydroorotate dehydrogenase